MPSDGGEQSKRLLLAHLGDTKDARGARVRWSDERVAKLEFRVFRGEMELRVLAIRTGSRDQQYMLFHPDWHRERFPIARLCTCKNHEATHWHYFDCPTEPRDTRDVQGITDEQLADPGYLLLEVFVPRLRIVRLEYEGRLTDEQ